MGPLLGPSRSSLLQSLYDEDFKVSSLINVAFMRNPMVRSRC